jgi:hypothetical protein
MKKIIFTRPDGGLSVVHPVINTYPVREEITEDEALERAMSRIPSDAIGVQVVDEVPADRTFRMAWVAGKGCIEHDMAKCREIHKENLRRLRAPKLAALDVAYQRADEAGDAKAKASIASQKQALRDVTADPGIASASTVQELAAVMPDAIR